ncbi:MAG: ETC complex I subunit [Rhodobacter sp.]|nr:ETC complex I subunit [Paracoccaceae bacterium]MCC0077173.1 ETC complex I subunit [Rhodobacter sp.]
MRARIYTPARNAMQSGTARTKHWVLDFAPGEARAKDPLMGWTGSGDTQTQVKLRFATQAEAEAYAKAQGIDYVVMQPKTRAANIRAGGYGENFATNRRQVWTH